jgi:hypothetical protein
MNDNDGNIVEFPTKERKDEVTRDRARKTKDFSSPFSSYSLNSVTFSSDGWEKWTPPSFDGDTISFSNLTDVNWIPTFGPIDTNLLTSIVDRCAAIQKSCINAGSQADTIALQHVLDKLDEALLLSKISSK